MQVNTLVDKIKNNLMRDYGKEAKDASIHEMHNVVAQVAISEIQIDGMKQIKIFIKVDMLTIYQQNS